MVRELTPCLLPEAVAAESRRLAEEAWGFHLEDVSPARDAAALARPVLLLHGLEDRYIVPAHAVRILERLPGPKRLLWLGGVGHVDVLLHDRAWVAILGWLDGLALPEGPLPGPTPRRPVVNPATIACHLLVCCLPGIGGQRAPHPPSTGEPPMSQSPSSLPVLVLGATGLVGARVTARLAADGIPVRGLARHPERARLPPGVDCRAGDALDPAALAGAVRGCRAVCLCLPWELEVAAAEALARACAGSGVHLVYLSGLTITPGNAGSPMVDAKLRAEAVLAATGLPLTVFKPSWFLEALPRFVRDGRATLFGRPALPYRLVALDEYAALVSAALAGDVAGVRTVVVEGPEAVALPDALQAYCDAAHPGLKVQVLPVWLGRAMAWLSRSAELEAAVALMAYFARVDRVSPEPPVVTRTGLPGWLARLPAAAGAADRSGVPAR